MANILLFRILPICISIIVSGSSSVGSDSESLLTCSKFHFEEKVLEKLVRLEHKMEMNEEKMKKWEVKLEALSSKIDEQMKRWESTFLSKLNTMDEAVNETEIFVESVRDIQLQEQSRINDSFHESVKHFKDISQNESEMYGKQINAMLESMFSKIEEFSAAETKRVNDTELMQQTLHRNQKRFNQSFDLILENTKLRSNKTIHELFAKQQKVAITACVTYDGGFYDAIVKFTDVRFHVGINNLNTFKSRGKFVCEIPGLYYISAYIRTTATNKKRYFYVKKNSNLLTYSMFGPSDIATTNSISAVEELQLGDVLHVHAANGNHIRGAYSCLSIMKVM